MMHSQKGQKTMKTGKRTDDFVNAKSLKLMEEISERLLQCSTRRGQETHSALKDYSREQLIEAIEEFDSQLGNVDYNYNYETDYWLDFVTNLIKANKINYHEWADSMPWSKHKAAEMLIERLIERIDEINWSHQQQQEPDVAPVSILDELRKKTAK